MKNFCIVSFCNIYVLPYANTYIDAIVNAGEKCSLLFWDRDAKNGENDNYPNCEKIYYQKKITPDSSETEKALGYFSALKFFRKIINRENFDGIIFLQTHAAVVCEDILRKKYMRSYIIDIRDYTWEGNKYYYKREKKAILNSYETVISSPAYARFLPKHEYIIAHNYNPFSNEVIQKVRSRKIDNNLINISFVGTVRFIDMDKKILSLFANDERFCINYFGTGSEVLEQYCADNGIVNSKFHGAFSPEMTTSFYETTDLINNLYGNHNKFLDDALSNKLYHAAQFYMPILVCPETYMEEISLHYNMGFVLDVDDKSSPDKLYRWYSNVDRGKLKIGCDEFIHHVKNDNQSFYKMISHFIERMG